MLSNIRNVRPSPMDMLLAGAMTVLSIVTAAETVEGTERTWAVVVGALTVAPLALRQRAPVLTAVVILLSLLAYSLLGYGVYPNGGGGLVIAMFTVAVLRSRPVALALWTASAVATGIMFATAEEEVPWSEAVQAPLTVLAGGWLLGEVTKHWAQHVERLAYEAALAAEQQRLSLARDLHDVVAHHMSIASMQAGVAEQVLESDPDTARAAIATAGISSREAMTETRHLLRLLRSPGTVVSTAVDDAPTPGLGQLDELADRVRGAGVPVKIVVTGRERRLPPGPELCAYRVAQESLTNVVKHAGPATARICIDYGEEMLTLTISDTGAGAGTESGPSASYGLLGMRERAAGHGGSLTAGPTADGGFEVTLRLPVGEAT